MKNKAPSSATKSDVTAMLIMESVPKGQCLYPFLHTSDYSKTHFAHSLTSFAYSLSLRNQNLQTWETSYLLAIRCHGRKIDIPSRVFFLFLSLCIATLKEEQHHCNVKNGVCPEKSPGPHFLGCSSQHHFLIDRRCFSAPCV